MDPIFGEDKGLNLIELHDEKKDDAVVPIRNEPKRIATNLSYGISKGY